MPALFPDATRCCIAVAGRAVGAGAGADSEEELDRALARHSGAAWYPRARRTWDTWTERLLATDDPAELAAMTIEVLPLYMAHPDNAGPQGVVETWRRTLRCNLAAAKAWESGLWDALDVRPLLLRVRCPTLLMAGEDDLICGPTHGQMMAGLIPDAELITLADCGHFIPAEQPGRWREEITAFCRRHSC